MRKPLFVLIALFIYLNIYGQCNEDIKYNVIINEIGSYVTQIEETDAHINDEFIELLVLGNPSKPFADVNLAGLIIDDNNRSGYAIGNEPGHIRIGDEFPLVPPGSLILIYNHNSTQFDFMSDGLPNDLGVFKLPLSSEYLNRISTTPSNNNPSYSTSQDYNSEPQWNNYIPFRNFGDVAQIRKPNGEFIHALGWYDQEIGQFDMPNHTIVFPGRLKNEAIKFVGENPKINTGFSKNSSKSPGYPNNDINENYINNIKAGVISSFTLSLELISSQTANNLDGEFQYTISSSSPGDRFLVFLNDQLHSETESGVYTMSSLAAGEYTIRVEGDSEDCEIEESISVPLEETIEEEVCAGECITLSAFDQDIDVNLINQSPCISWLDENNNVLAFGPTYVVCPTGPETFRQYIENESELTEIILTYNVTISNSGLSVSLSTNPIGNGECTAEGITIESSGNEIETYAWSTDETESSINVESPDEYSITVTDKNGCTAEATLTLEPEDFEVGDSDGDGICDEDDPNPDDPCVPDGVDSDGDGLCDNTDCFPNDVTQTFSIGDPCDDGNASTISDEINSDCICEGTPDPDNPCNGNDIDGDGICDDDDPNPNDPCDPNGEDSDGDGVCDNADCFPNDDTQTFSIGDPCDDGNASTINDKINSDCICEGTSDPNNPCDGNDTDGDGICNDEDPFPDDACNELKVTVSGDLILCFGDEDAVLNADITGGIEPFSIEWSNGTLEEQTTVNISNGDTYNVTVTDKIDCTVEFTAFIQVQEMRINISPEVVALCPLTNQGKEVECVQDFDTYLWESEGAPSQTTKIALISTTGDWTLTVTKDVDGMVCTEIFEFVVHDLGSPEGIKKYLDESGFYAVPITFDPTTTLKTDESGSTRNGCTSVEDFRFTGADEENFDFIQPDVFNATATDVLANFKILTKYTEGQSQLFTANDCLCEEADISDLEEEFDVGQVSVWMHQFKNDDDTKGKLFLKAKMPYSDISPVDDVHRDYLSGAKHEKIIKAGINGSTDEHCAVLLKNLFMTKPFTGFGQVAECSPTFEPNTELNFMTPASIPVNLSSDIATFAFSDGEGLLEEGMLIYYNDEDLEYRSYQYDNFFHAGYYTDDTGEFEENFPLIEGSDGQLEVIFPYQCNGTCEYTQENIEFDAADQSLTAGFELDINPFSSKKKLSFDEVNNWVLDKFCRIKNKKTIFPTQYHHVEDKFIGKMVFAKDIYIGNRHYDYIGMKIIANSENPDPNLYPLDIIDVDENNSEEELFEDAIVLSDGLTIRICAFENETCKKIKPSYSLIDEDPPADLMPINESDGTESTHGTNVDLFHFLSNNHQKDNLLLFVNGYRNNLEKKKLYAFNQDFDRQSYTSPDWVEYEDYNTSNCSGVYEESGSYWDETARLFSDRITTDNIYYFDGHDKITTSNHAEEGNALIPAAKLRFTTSLISSYWAAGFKLPEWLFFGFKGVDWFSNVIQGAPVSCYHNNNCVTLNDEDNQAGFIDRYINGVNDAQSFWEDMDPENPNRTVFVSMNSDHEITGHIDIVAHSMGFAHAMGMISVLKEHMAPDEDGNKRLGRFYILAPENSCSIEEGFSVDDFEEVWQYGSSPNNPNLWEVDGVAVQCHDLDNMPEGNKIYLEDYNEATEQFQDFLNAHFGENYPWIFSEIPGNKKGFVKERN